MSRLVKTPRFYVDIPTFLHATGDLHWDGNKGGAELLYMNPSNPFLQTDLTNSTPMFLIGGSESKTSFPVNFVALLNHNFGSDSNRIQINGVRDFNDFTHVDLSSSPTNIINFDPSTFRPEYNGTSIFTFSEKNDYWKSFNMVYPNDIFDTNFTHQLGSFVVGKYWDAPNSPDLNLTMSRRFEGIKRQKTINGKILANTYYDSPTEWTMNPKNPDYGGSATYKYPPFELDTTNRVDSQGYRIDYRAKSGLGRKGLRSWKLTFSYISEDDMWMDNEVSNTLTSDDVTPNDGIPNPMLSDNSFNFVWNCTLGGTLPFIFQPDKTNNNPDQFSICTFRGNSLSVKQVAHNTYSLSITIDEVA